MSRALNLIRRTRKIGKLLEGTSLDLDWMLVVYALLKRCPRCRIWKSTRSFARTAMCRKCKGRQLGLIGGRHWPKPRKK